MNGLRYAMPAVHGRGAGLGNELFPWGKAFIAAQTLGISHLHPAWGLNPRGYHRYFGTSRADWLMHRGLRMALPTYSLSQERYRKHGCVASAVKEMSSEYRLEGKAGYVIDCSGMWGGVLAVAPARDFLLGQLLTTRGTPQNMLAFRERVKGDALTIGFHIRRGDFKADTDYRGKFNIAVPLEWYLNIARNIAADVAGARFVIVSDASREELLPLIEQFDCILTDDLPDRDVSDLLTLAACDLIVCSISSYSIWAAFFGNGRYIWFAPNLGDDVGLLSLWGHEALQKSVTGETRAAADYVRQAGGRPKGIGVGWDGRIPREMIEHLGSVASLKRRETDLVRFGVLPF